LWAPLWGGGFVTFQIAKAAKACFNFVICDCPAACGVGKKSGDSVICIALHLHSPASAQPPLVAGVPVFRI
jgi:hypothetical protein